MSHGNSHHPQMKTIVLADDSTASREMVREFMEVWGYQVIEAVDGDDALQKIHETRPDLVLCDIQMPVLDGFAVLRYLRQDRQIANIPIIALTAFAMRGDKERILSAGFDGYQSKPIAFEALKADIEQLLHHHEVNAAKSA